MAELFNTTRNNITLHIGNIFKEGELEVNSVRKESLLTAADLGMEEVRSAFSTKLSVMKDYPDKMTVEPDS